ncbi:MAG: HAMP domain-containing protein, partial [Clostridiales bacterium]|nr:HAMP domain-containing protein [Clostridiales bacterium]
MKFRLKITICIIIFSSLAFGIGGNLLIAASFSASLRQEKLTAADSYQTILNMLRVVNSVSTQTYYGDVVDALQQLEQNGGGNWDALRLSMDGDVIYSSSKLTAFSSDFSQSENINQYSLLIFQNEDSHYLQVSGTLEAGEKTLYLDSLYDITSIYETRMAQQKIYRYVFSGILAAGFALSWLFSHFLTRPIRELTDAARKISDGDLSVRAQVSSSDEIGLLARDFNRMTDNLARHIDEMQDAMERQDTFMGDFAHELKTPMTA